MRNAITIALKDLKLRFRDRSAIIFAFVAPLGLAAIITFAFGGGGDTFHATYVIADLDKSDVTKAFTQVLETGFEESVTLKTAASFEEARKLVTNGEASAGFLIPEDFSEKIQRAEPTDIQVLRNTNAPVGSSIAESIAQGFVTEVNAGRLSVQTAVETGALARPGAGSLQDLIARSTEGRIPVTLVQGKLGGRAVNSASYFGPAMAIFFLSFTVQFGLIGIRSEQREGTLRRILASPTRASQAILGKSLGAFVLGIISLAVMAVATTLLLGASWGPPLGVAILGAATIFAFMGVAAIGVTLARTEEGAQGFMLIVMSVFALLGGNFIRITDAPPLFQTLSLGTPNGWALRGFIDLSTGGGIPSILPPVLVLLGIGAITMVIAFSRRKRLVMA